MGNFIFNVILWSLAIYGFFEIVKILIRTYIHPKISSSGIYLIVAAKNEENKIEGFLRSFLFRLLYGKEDYIDNIFVVDLNSTDRTPDIMNLLAKDYDCINYTDLKSCNQIFDNIAMKNKT